MHDDPSRAPAAAPRRAPASAASLLAAARAASRHAGLLLRLARTEIRGNLRALAALVLLFGGAAGLTVVALFLFLIALRDALAALIGSEPLAGLIVAAPFLGAAGLLIRAGLRRMDAPRRGR